MESSKHKHDKQIKALLTKFNFRMKKIRKNMAEIFTFLCQTKTVTFNIHIYLFGKVYLTLKNTLPLTNNRNLVIETL